MQAARFLEVVHHALHESTRAAALSVLAIVPTRILVISPRHLDPCPRADGRLGNDPFVNPQKTILCINTISGDLGEYSADGTTFRIIVKKDVQSSMTYKNYFKDPQLSPDGKSVAYEGQLGYTFDIYVVDRASGQLLASQNPPTVGLGYVRPTWVPDGTLVVAGGTQNPGLYRSNATWTTFTRFDQGLTTPDRSPCSRTSRWRSYHPTERSPI